MSTAPDAQPADYALLALAGRGDLDALRQLAQHGIGLFHSDRDVFALMEGLTFARLAAAIGGEGDAGLLLGALACLSDYTRGVPDWAEWSDNVGGEMLAIASRLADAGAEQADEMLIGISERTSARAVAVAHEVVDVMPLMGGDAEC